MRYFKQLLVALFFAMVLVNSCQADQDGSLLNENPNNQERIALQSLFNGMTDETYNAVSSNYTADSLCFHFVYPIQLTYNTQNTITINNFNGLIEVINNQSAQLYITGIVTPFQITMNGQTQTINTEVEMVALLESCDYFSINDAIENSFCFDIVFPIYITSETGQNVAINNIQDFLTFLDTQTNVYQADIVFPITVIFEGQSITIANLFAFNELINSCFDNECVCAEYYSPVCIQTPNGVVEYGNMCYAECAGYSQNDVVPCDNGGDCSIFNLTFTVGDCGANDTFSLTLDFDYNNPDEDEFEVYARDSVAGSPAFWDLKGTYPLSQMPITIQNVPDAETTYQSIKVQIKDHPDCYLIDGFESPNCGGNDGCVCPAIYAPVCVQGPNGIITFDNACFAECAGYTQNDFVACESSTFNFGQLLGTCFTIQYPVQIEHNGQTITANSNGDVLQYYHPDEAPIPALVYPISVTFINPNGNTTVTVNSQAAFVELIGTHCD